LSRIERTFRRLAGGNEAALIPYVTVGHPTLETTRTLLPVMARQGVDLIMLGTTREVAAAQVLAVAEEARRTNEIPLVLVVNSMDSLDFGADFREVVERVAGSGVDGLFVSELPPGIEEQYMRICQEAGIDFILPVPQTGLTEHLKAMLGTASGFVYCMVPGPAIEVGPQPLEEIAAIVADLREHASLPVVADSHAGTPEHVAELSRFADGVVVSGSLLKVIDSLEGDDVILGVSDHLRSLKDATRK
jgi:tryptophan synthase alpha chain